jgi:hypothetical protein
MENNEIIDNNEINSTTEVETNQVPQEPTWLNEMPEKFRTNAKDYDEMVNNAIKSYKNLEYQQSKTFGKPEKYTINEDLKIDEGLLSIAKEVSKELNLSQDMFHKVASTTQKIWAEREKEYNATIEQKTQDLETKMKDYGSDKLSELNNFVSNLNISKGSIENLNKMLTNNWDDFIPVLEELKNKFTENKLSLQPRETVDNNGFTDNDKNDIIFQYNQLVKRGATVRPTTEQQKIINQYNKIKGW